MADGSKIEWTDATWNPITGCSVVSPGCTNCYAMRLAGTRMKHHPSRIGLTDASKAGPVWNGTVRLNAQWLDQPLRWRKPRRIFVCAHGDLFHESVPDEWIDRVFAVMALATQHTFQVLTKRAQRMREYLSSRNGMADWRLCDAINAITPSQGDRRGCLSMPLFNVWLGVSAEDQRRADERIPALLDTPAAVRFISAEPLLGAIDLRYLQPGDPPTEINALEGTHGVLRPHQGQCDRVDWVIVGGESEPGARPMHLDWARSLRDQCVAAGVAFHFKQWGEWVPQVGAVDGWTIDDDPEISKFDHRDWEHDRWGHAYRPMWCDERDDDTVSRIGKKRSGRQLDGRTWDQVPEVAG